MSPGSNAPTHIRRSFYTHANRIASISYITGPTMDPLLQSTFSVASILLPFLLLLTMAAFYPLPAAANYYTPPVHMQKQRGYRLCDQCGIAETPYIPKFRLCGGCVRPLPILSSLPSLTSHLYLTSSRPNTACVPLSSSLPIPHPNLSSSSPTTAKKPTGLHTKPSANTPPNKWLAPANAQPAPAPTTTKTSPRAYASSPRRTTHSSLGSATKR